MADQQSDPALFTLVHDLTVAEAEAEERRGRDRKNFPTVQLIAPYRNGQLPSREMLQSVRCQDLSTGGMAFFYDDVPDFEHLVVGLSSTSQMIYLTAAVAHHKPVETGEGSAVLVGCRFLGRVML